MTHNYASEIGIILLHIILYLFFIYHLTYIYYLYTVLLPVLLL